MERITNHPLLGFLYLAVKGVGTAVLLFVLFWQFGAFINDEFKDWPLLRFFLIIPTVIYLFYILPQLSYRAAISHLK